MLVSTRLVLDGYFFITLNVFRVLGSITVLDEILITGVSH